MAEFSLSRRLTAEALGTALLLATVVGSGIMGTRLAGDAVALTLLVNALATGAMLVVLILVFGPISGAHLNPAVTLAFVARREIVIGEAFLYVGAQSIGALIGVAVAHGMFAETILQASTTGRTGAAQWLSEAVATFGLVAAILGTRHWRPDAVPAAVGLYIAAGYWFTASTSFANPAVTVARAFTNTFAGIDPTHVPAFIAAQGLGALVAVALFGWLLVSRPTPGPRPRQ